MKNLQSLISLQECSGRNVGQSAAKHGNDTTTTRNRHVVGPHLFRTVLLLLTFLTLGVGEMWAWQARGTFNSWGAGTMTQSTANTAVYYYKVNGTGKEFKVTGDSGWGDHEMGSGYINNDLGNITLSGSGNISGGVSGDWYICYHTTDDKVYATTTHPNYPDMVIAGNNFGSIGSWSTTATPMTNNGDGTYTKTINSVGGATDCQFKIVYKGTWTGEKGHYTAKVSGTNCTPTGNNSGGNISFSPIITGDVTITYTQSTGAITITCPTPTWTSIYVYNDASFASMYLYTYSEELNGSWPGTNSTYVSSLGSNWYEIKILTGATKFIINDNSSKQTNDLTTSEYTEGRSYHFKANGTKYDLEEYKFTVSFNMKGHGSAVSDQSVYYNGLVSEPSAPTADGYTFGGWYKETGCTNAWNFSTDKVTATTTLYAKWTKKTYTVTVNNDGHGTTSPSGAQSSIAQVDGVAIGATANTNYEFVNWTIESGTGSFASAATTASNTFYPTSAATIQANFRSTATNSLTVVAGAGISSVTGSTDPVTLGNSYAITATPLAGYTFSTWTADVPANASFASSTSASTNVTVSNGSVTVTASATEDKRTLTPTVSYDHGSSNYTATSANTLGVVTTSVLTASTPNAAHYTFAGWTLTNLTITSGSASSLSVTVKVTNPALACSAVANYEEVLTQSTWVIKGGTAISGSNWGTNIAMSKASGASTSDVVYATINISSTNTGDSNGAYKFKVVKLGSSDSYFGLDASGQYYLMRRESGTEKTLDTDNSDIELRADVTGDYVFKVDYSTPASPKLTVTWPTAVYLSADDESAYADGSVTLTAEGANLTSGSKTIEYEFFKGNNTLPANLVGTKQTFSSVTGTSHSTTQVVSPGFSASDYSASQVYTVKMTVDGTPYTNTITIYRKWDIYVHDVQSWGGVSLYMWSGSRGDNASWPGAECSTYKTSDSWYKVTLSSKYDSGFLVNAGDGDATKTTDMHIDGDDYDGTSDDVSEYAEGTYWYVTASPGGHLKQLSMSAPAVELKSDDPGTHPLTTTQLRLVGEVTNFGGDGNCARDMLDVGFQIGETKYSIPHTCTGSDAENGYFWGTITSLTANTSYTVKAYATNIYGTTVSSNSVSLTTYANTTVTIKVRTLVDDPVPNIFAWSTNDCGGASSENASYPGVSMGSAVITGTTYKWYSYELSHQYTHFLVNYGANSAAADLVKTDDFENPHSATCYWYAPSENNEEGHKRMGTMACPYLTPQLMIDDGTDANYEYNEMTVDGSTISKTISLNAKTGYRFKIVYNSEWYGKAGTNVTRADNTLTGISSAVEDNLYITTDVAGSYTFSYNTSTGLLTVTYPTAYTVTFGSDGHGTVTAEATNPDDEIASGDYVASGATVTFAQTPATGYTLKGWYTTVDGNTSAGLNGDNELTINGAKTVYAQYTPNEYTVTFDAATNGGTCGTASKSVTFDAPYGELPVATKGAQAYAWFTTASGEGAQVTAETVVSTADDHTIYARFEDKYTVNIDFQCGDAKLLPSTTTTASVNYLTAEISAPEVLGYTFNGWTGSNATFGDASNAETTLNTSAATTITANYTLIPTVYFKNNLNWEHVYVTFDCGWTTVGGKDVPSNNGKPYYQMTQLGTSDIFYCIIPDAIVASWKGSIAFDNVGYDYSNVEETHTGNYSAFWKGEFLGRGDFDLSATMFIPYNGDYETRNEGTYYRTGCWMKYNSTDPGYKIYTNTDVTGSGSAVGEPVLLTASMAGGFEFKAIVNLPTANRTYGFMLHKEWTTNNDAEWYSNTGTIEASNRNTLPWHFSTDGATATGTRCGIHTEATGDYEFTVSFGTGRPVVDVTYPVSVNDWRLVYKDRAAWSGAAHDAGWSHPSRVIKAKADAEDIVSFFVSKADGANATIELQKCTAIDGGTGEETWTKQGDNLDLSAITGTGIYNFKVTQDGEGDATAAYDGSYSGNFYIRTDASDGGWSNYKTSGTNTMTYSEYAEDNHDFTHYFMRYVTTGTNIKFCIANDYSPCLTEYCVSDSYTNEWIEANGNIRFMWDHRTNAVSRAYISGSSIVSDRFLVLEGDDKMFDEDGNDLTDSHQVSGLEEYEMKFTDDQNWIYEATVKAKPGARIKLTAKYNNKIQYFYGAEGARSDATTEQLLGGEGDTQYKIRIVYDFKTNRLIKALIPEGAIEDDLSIEADLMIIREAQEDAQQITFNGGSLEDVKTVYGAMKFNKYTVNGKEKTGGHALTGDSQYKRDIFYISFPFDVKLSDVFGFGTYGKHWIIEYYDGKERAEKGFWADTKSFWKFVTPAQRSSFTMKAFEGYILALDLEEMTESSSVWNNGVEDVYVYFPSSEEVEDIQATNRLVEIDQEGYECTIGPRFEGGDDRTKKDSYWHVIGVPSFANYDRDLTVTNGGTAIDWSNGGGEIDWETPSFPYLYEWNSSDNSLTVTSSATFTFKAMYSYMVQYAGTSIYWSQVNVTPSVVARRESTPTNVEFRLELQQGEQKADQAFIRMTNDEVVTAGFDFNYDLSKEFNKNKANIYTLVNTEFDEIASVTEAAGNVLPLSEQTTIVPVGVKIAANDDYTFTIPDGTSGVGVTLIDTETGIRTNLSALDYTVSLEEGTYNERFVMEISPIQQVITDVQTSEINDQKSDVRKQLIDGLLYIVRDGKMYDARGAKVE